MKKINYVNFSLHYSSTKLFFCIQLKFYIFQQNRYFRVHWSREYQLRKFRGREYQLGLKKVT